MNTVTMKNTSAKPFEEKEIPKTARGRALYTVDWFLNGTPVLRNHDNPKLSLSDGCRC